MKIISSKNKQPYSLIYHKKILARIPTKKGWNKISFDSCSIILSGDYFISVEFLPSKEAEENYIVYGLKLLRGNAYSRVAVTGKWQKMGAAYTIKSHIAY